MRYTIEKQKEVQKLAEDGRSLEYIAAFTNIPKKVIWQWCPELRPHEDIIKQSVKQRYHYMFPDYEAKISAAFSPLVRDNVSEDDWDSANKIIYDTLFEEALYVFKNVVSEPPNFSEVKKLSEDKFLDYLKQFWSMDSDYIQERHLSENYVNRCRNFIHYWSFLKNKLMRDVTKGDIEIIHEKLIAKKISQGYIYSILKTGLIPLEYAYNNGLTLLKTYDYKLPKKTKKDYSVSPDLISKIFNAKWNNQEAYLANLIAYYASFTAEEVRNLRLKDIYTDGAIKNVTVPETVVNAILKYASTSPYQDFKADDFVFYSADRNKPVSLRHSRNWNTELQKIVSEFTDKNISFYFWSISD